jgi:hypothetical protein
VFALKPDERRAFKAEPVPFLTYVDFDVRQV